MGDLDFGIQAEMMDRVVSAIKSASQQGVQVAIVVGGGNIFRGVQGSASGMNRTRADQMGMMATVMNGLALLDALERAGQLTQAFCAIEMPRVMNLFHRDEAAKALDRGEVCVFSGGTGNPFFTTDSAAALRGAELEVDEVLKGTQVDGVYEADPHKVKTARRFEEVSFATCLSERLQVMDASAFAICQSEGVRLRVFNMHQENALEKALLGEVKGTLVGVGLESIYASS
jgi:uridylate kinase